MLSLARAYHSSNERTEELCQWLRSYNWHRPHRGTGSKQCSRLALNRNNLLRLHSYEISQLASQDLKGITKALANPVTSSGSGSKAAGA